MPQSSSTTAANHFDRREAASRQAVQSMVQVGKLTAVLLAGSLAVVGPWWLDALVGRAMSVKMARMLSARTGASVRVGRVRPAGLVRPRIVAKSISMTDRNLSVTIPEMTLTVGASRWRVSIQSPLLVADQGALNRLAHGGRIAATAAKGPLHGSSGLSRLFSRADITIQNGRAFIRFSNSPFRTVSMSAKTVRLSTKRNRHILEGAVTSRLVARDGSHLDSRLTSMRLDLPGLVGWLKTLGKERAIPGKQLTMRALTGLDWVERAQGRFSMELSAHRAKGIAQWLGKSRSKSLKGAFRLETLADGLVDAKVLVSDAKGLSWFQAVAAVDRVASSWNATISFKDVPARGLARIIPGIRIAQGRVDGTVALRSVKGMLRAGMDVRFDGDAVLSHRLVADRPIFWRGLGLTLAARLTGQKKGWDVRIQRATIQRNDVELTVFGRLTKKRNEGWLVDLSARLPKNECQDLFDALPPSLVPKLAGMELSGKLAAMAHFAADSRDLEHLVADLTVSGGCRVVADPPKADVHRLLEGSVTLPARDKNGQPTILTLGRTNPFYRTLKSLPAHLVRAFLVTEDRRFFVHEGFDWNQIRKALAFDIQHRAVIKGASSISQQVIKNIYLDHHRTLSRKLQEAILTWRLEQVVPKRRILELYVNLVEMGPGIYGVARGARTYFHKNVRALTPLESLHLASITPAPRHFYRTFKNEGRVGLSWLLRLRHRLAWMYRSGWISAPEYNRLRQRELFLAAF